MCIIGSETVLVLAGCFSEVTGEIYTAGGDDKDISGDALQIAVHGVAGALSLIHI